MSLQVFKEIRAAVANLDPAEVQAAADRPLRIGLLAASERGFAAMKEFLLPSEKVSERKRAEGAALLDRALGSEPPDHFDVVLCEQGLPCPRNGYTFFAGQPEETVLACLLHDLGLWLIKPDHGWWGAQLVEPYVSEKISWAIRYHQALRFYPDAPVGYE